MSTTILCQKLTDVATGLTAYAHLPELGSVSVYDTVYLGFPLGCGSTQALTWLCAWADAVDVSITIELSYGGSGSASIGFDLAGYRARIRVDLHSGQAYELGAALCRPISTDNPMITLSPAALRTALTEGTGADRLAGGDRP
jgi:hypothetical protein